MNEEHLNQRIATMWQTLTRLESELVSLRKDLAAIAKESQDIDPSTHSTEVSPRFGLRF